MKKTDVYVVVDTPKKAKKLKKVLDMFGEKLYSFDTIEHCLNNNKMMAFSKNWNWFHLGFTENETEVSIKELRNILAKEHLKEGDVCLFDDRKGFKSIGVFDKYSEEYKDFLVSKVPGKDSVRYGFHDFIRYATEEEKALLEPNKELEVGKWYKGNVDIESLIFITEIENVKYYNRIHGYGFIGGKWHYSGHLFSNTYHEKALVEANDEEVEKALIEEAKRRYKVGDKLSKVRDDHADDNRFFESNSFGLENNCLYFDSTNGSHYSYCVFDNGQWATIIEHDKLSNLKEAYNNGYCVEFYDGKTDTWKRHENPCWNPELKWRIMVNNGHLVVSDVYLLNQIKELKKSIEEIKSNIK